MKEWLNIFQKNNEQAFNIDKGEMPEHVAIIMDGNGRWAQKRQMPRALGHKAGVEALRDVIKTADSIGLKYLTFYAFSTENWKRPADEVSTLMQLLVEYLKKEVKELHENKVRIHTIGDIDKLPEKPLKEVLKAKELTQNNTGLWVNIALNYGGRDELIRGIKRLIDQVSAGTLSREDINEETIGLALDTNGIPDPELIIRTSGEHRLSNFLLWQCAYSEFWFTETFWPDFRGKDLIEGIRAYQNRDRRFGAV
ncbi:isoprenyl transferase [Alkaliphilus crotonatoxidans]